MTQGTTIFSKEWEAKQVKATLPDKGALQPQGANPDTAKQREEADPQKYKVVWWMLDDTPAKFTEVLETKAEAIAFARGLHESGIIGEESIEVRKVRSRAQVGAA